jgi:hypothetical protein
MTEFELDKFDYDDLPPHPVICNLGKRRSGKTNLTRDQCYHYFFRKAKYPNVILFSPTGSFNNDYDFVPERFRYEAFDPGIIDALMERQKAIIKSDPKAKIDTLLIFDDIIRAEGSSSKAALSKLTHLFTVSRHYRIAIIANLQYMKAQEFNPTMRDNLDFLFVFSQSNHDTKLEIVKQWLAVGEKHEGLDVLQQTAQQYRTLVIDNTSKSSQLDELCFWYQADNVKRKFVLGKR